MRRGSRSVAGVLILLAFLVLGASSLLVLRSESGAARGAGTTGLPSPAPAPATAVDPPGSMEREPLAVGPREPEEAGAPPSPVELPGDEPGVVLLAVRVLLPDGTPAAGVQVTLWVRETLPRDQWRIQRFRQSTDGEGYCELSAPQEPLVGAKGEVWASDETEHVSRIEDLVFPWTPGVLVLRLQPAGALEVLVLDDGGAPVPWADVWPTYWERSNARVAPSGHTDDEGTFFAPCLPAGTYLVQVRDRHTSRYDEELVEVAEGETCHVTIRLPPDELAVAGRVLDESGAPLEDVDVTLCADGCLYGTVTTDEDGNFEWRCVQAEVVRVAVDPLDDRYLPDVEKVAFGTTGLVFHRAHAVAESTLRVEIVDAGTGAALADSGALLFQDKPLGSGTWLDNGAECDDWKLCGVSRFVAAAKGYRDATGALSASLDRSGDVPVLRAALVPGTSRDVWVSEWSDETVNSPPGGVAVSIDGRLIGHTDACGLVHVDSDDPDPEVVFSKEGFEDEVWYPQRDWDEFYFTDQECWNGGVTLVGLRRVDPDEEH